MSRTIDDLIAHYEPMTDAYGSVQDAHRLAIALKNARGALKTLEAMKLGDGDPHMLVSAARLKHASDWVREIAAEGLKEEP